MQDRNQISESVNSTVSQKVLSEFRRPGWAEILIYLLCGLVLVMLVNIRTLGEAISNSVQTTAIDTSKIIDLKLVELGDHINSLLSGRPGQMLFWAIVGCLIYVLIWLSQNFLINIRNDVVSDKYMHPKSYESTSYWQGVIAHKIFFGAVIVTFLLYCYFAVIIFIPVLSKIFYYAALNFKLLSSTLELLIIIIFSAIVIYVGVFLAKLISHSWKSIINSY